MVLVCLQESHLNQRPSGTSFLCFVAVCMPSLSLLNHPIRFFRGFSFRSEAFKFTQIDFTTKLNSESRHARRLLKSHLGLIFLHAKFPLFENQPFSPPLVLLIPCPACPGRRVSQLQPGRSPGLEMMNNYEHIFALDKAENAGRAIVLTRLCNAVQRNKDAGIGINFDAGNLQ